MSQMSLSSDILDRPLGDKVVLEENLGTRQQRTDMEEEEEETQDSSIADHHEDDRHHRDQDDDDDDGECRLASRRARLDSESRSSPPHFLHEEEESNVSNLSSTSNMGMKEDEHPHHRHRREEAEKSDSSSLGKAENSIDSLAEVVMNISSVTNGENTISKPTGSMTAGVAADSALARLPSFSSIINGSPKILASPVAVDENGGERDGGSEKMRKIIPLLWIFTPSEIQIFTIECPYLRAGGSGVSRKMCSVLIRVLKKEKQLNNT